jgi:hypothetical protein
MNGEIHVAAWFRREDYERIREIMDDGDRLPPAFDEWERTAKEQLSQAAANGVTITPVVLDPDKFLAYCKEKNLSGRGGAERAAFAIEQERARDLH